MLVVLAYTISCRRGFSRKFSRRFVARSLFRGEKFQEKPLGQEGGGGRSRGGVRAQQFSLL